MATSFTRTLLAVAILAAAAQANILIQSDGVGEVLDGPEAVTISNYNYGGRLEMPYDGAKVIWGPNWNS